MALVAGEPAAAGAPTRVVRVRRARWVGIRLTVRGWVDVYDTGSGLAWEPYPRV